jgi:hypothetical protein
MPLLRLLERRNAGADLERYLRDERLYAELDLARLQNADPRQLTLERNLYAVSSYFAA